MRLFNMNDTNTSQSDTAFVNPKIVSDVIDVLDAILPKNLYALDFTLEHYFTLLKKLSLFEKEEYFNDKKEAIKKAIVSYFAQSNQHIDIKISFKTFTIHKHFFDHSNSEKLDRTIHKNRALISDLESKKSEFLPLPFLVSIPNEFYTQIMQGYIDNKQSMESARYITRQQVDNIFNLDERDIIFFLRGKISIRYFTPPKKIPEGVDKRFSGESIESMEIMYQTYFPDGAWPMIEEVLDDVLADSLNFAFISNMTFSKTFIQVFRSMVEVMLLDIVSEDDRSKIEGQTGYILRQYFQKILLHTSKNLLNFIENRNKNAEKFVNYFTEETVIDANGNKIQKYAITDKRNNRWNCSAVISLMMQYKQTKIKVAAQDEVLAIAQERVNESEKEIESEKKSKHNIEKELEEIVKLLPDADMKLMSLKEKLSSNSDESEAIKNEMVLLNDYYNELITKRKSHIAQLESINNKITNKISELAQRNIKLAYEEKIHKTIMEQSAPVLEMYELVADALAFTLAKR
ncbi:MAG TPA: hypothetical protein VEZ39_07785 [Sulfuricurvum sp.]|nr:hypothetical protein [Sulfuricurvum sp.]